MSQLSRAAIVGQSGGPTAAINASLAGVIKASLSSGAISSVYGMRNGIEGLLKEDIIRIDLSDGDISLLSLTPASALGSCRVKLPDDLSSDEYKIILRIFEKYDIGYFYYIGGNDSMDTVAKLSEYFRSAGLDIKVIGVPKTIDNDLTDTDHTPGYGSAAKYIAVTMQEIIRDCAVYTKKAVTIVEIMGRDSGWLTAAAAIPGRVCGVKPDLIYLPERPFDIDRFMTDVKSALERHPNVVVAVSEGIRDADGNYIGAAKHKGLDVFGHVNLSGAAKALEIAVKEEIGCKVRSIELNLPQRCASHVCSATDINESFKVGEAAVEAALNGQTGKMMCFVRHTPGYSVDIVPRDISEIANKAKTVPDEYINSESNGVTEECVDYMLPLIQGETEQIWENGLPKHFTFDLSQNK
ncbi:MAG: 6-phosphofructokinase [Clostridiales bacterium]|nr:6-phosphofructokinase [Clostridiales bacterium]